MPIVVLTFVRHGESVDNLKDVWSGWKDAHLSELGENQAKAAGESLSTTPFSYIIASPLHRAYDTARAIHSAQPESTRPNLVSSPLLKEQHYGIAEGKKWTLERIAELSDEGHWAAGRYPGPVGRKGKFPEGESLDDLRDRARQAVKELVVPIIRAAVNEKKENIHVALVSHGLCVSELVPAVVALDYERRSKGLEVPDRQYAGLLNTAWTRASIDLAAAGEIVVDENGLPPLSVKVTDVNCHQHLQTLECMRGNSNQDHSAQSDIKKRFFGGAFFDGDAEALVEDKARSDVMDGAVDPHL